MDNDVENSLLHVQSILLHDIQYKAAVINTWWVTLIKVTRTVDISALCDARTWISIGLVTEIVNISFHFTFRIRFIRFTGATAAVT